MGSPVANRRCEDCRRWLYDEETGERILSSKSLPVLRTGRVPCEASIGCEKGHWRSNPDLGPIGEQILDDFLLGLTPAGAIVVGPLLAGSPLRAFVHARLTEIRESYAVSLQRQMLSRMAMLGIPGRGA